MAMYAKVRQLFYREKLSISEITRQTGLSRNTIKKWVRQSEGITPKYARTLNVGKLAAFESRLFQLENGVLKLVACNNFNGIMLHVTF